jgi:hypothetical protein
MHAHKRARVCVCVCVSMCVCGHEVSMEFSKQSVPYTRPNYLLQAIFMLLSAAQSRSCNHDHAITITHVHPQAPIHQPIHPPTHQPITHRHATPPTVTVGASCLPKAQLTCLCDGLHTVPSWPGKLAMTMLLSANAAARGEKNAASDSSDWKKSPSTSSRKTTSPLRLRPRASRDASAAW